jgi:uncharacterized protein
VFAVRRVGPALLAGSMFLAAMPASADVKDGVDAWTRGDFAAAVAQWEPPASQGDPDALFNLAQAYKLGRGVPQDHARAEALFGQASSKGHAQASDNYGLLLFQRGERAKALPYVTAAADRGDSRAQYIMGIAHFNGDAVPKDWVRAYALISLARHAGLAQAVSAIAQMDQHIPLAERQQSMALAQQMAASAKAARDRQLAAVGLGASVPNVSVVALAPSAVSGSSPRDAGADYARPRSALKPASAAVAAASRAAPVAVALPPEARWKVQLGAFGVPANAEALWERVKTRPEIAGHARMLVPAGKVQRLLASGYASQSAAKSACLGLGRAGFACLPVAD